MTREEAIKVAYGIPVTKEQHEALQFLIPELVESEDERTRKELIFFLKEEIPQCSIKEHADKLKEFVAYLENQKDAFENGRQFGIMQEQARQELEWVDEKQKEEEGYEAIPVESTLEYKLGFKAGKESEKQNHDGKKWIFEDEYQKDLDRLYNEGKDEVLNNPSKYGLQKGQKPALVPERIRPKFAVGDTICRPMWSDHTIQEIYINCNDPVYVCVNEEGTESHIPMSEQDEWERKEQKTAIMKPHKGDAGNPYDMGVSEAQDYAINRGFGIPFNDGEVFVDERYIAQTIGNILRWADEHPKDKKPEEWNYDNRIQYDSVKSGIEAFASTYSFNIESRLFPQLTNEQQRLWREEIEQAVIAGGEDGIELSRDNRYEENRTIEWSKEDEKLLDFWLDVIDRNDWRMDENFCKASREFINRLKSIHPQPKQEWSEEDEKMLKETLALIETIEDINKMKDGFLDVKIWLKDHYHQPKQEWSEDIIRKAIKEVGLTQHQIDWFKTNVFPPKQEWSEEDELHRGFILESLEDQIRFCKKNAEGAYYAKQIRTAQNWLKNIHPSWKPSKEEMEALDIACSGKLWYGEIYLEGLRRIREQLRKL